MPPTQSMPRYRCHKEVAALKIARVSPVLLTGAPNPVRYMIMPADERYSAFTVEPSFFHKHNPQAGGYYVVYENGYESFSPAKPFESGYELIDRAEEATLP